MQEDYIECSELSGKTILTLRIHKDAGDGTDVQIELTDGTSFSCCLSNQPAVKASLYRGGVGTPRPSAATTYKHFRALPRQPLFLRSITHSLEFIGRSYASPFFAP